MTVSLSRIEMMTISISLNSLCLSILKQHQWCYSNSNCYYNMYEIKRLSTKQWFWMCPYRSKFSYFCVKSKTCAQQNNHWNKYRRNSCTRFWYDKIIFLIILTDKQTVHNYLFWLECQSSLWNTSTIGFHFILFQGYNYLKI